MGFPLGFPPRLLEAVFHLNVCGIMEGWVKNHRKILEWEWFKEPNMYHVFSYLILSANSIEKDWHGIKILRGQLVAGRKTLSVSTGISEQSIRTCLVKLKSTNEITIKSTNQYSIITICNYDHYQDKKTINNQEINQPLHQRSTNDQPTINHKQEEENIRSKEKEKEKESFLDFKTEEIRKEEKPDLSFLDTISQEEYEYMKKWGKTSVVP